MIKSAVDTLINPSGLVIFNESFRVPAVRGDIGTNTHSPRLSAKTSPIFSPWSKISTLDPGMARPAMTESPPEVTRTISKLGTTV